MGTGSAAVLAAIVPVKDLETAKTRLASILSPEERANLCLVMLGDILAALRDTPAVGTTLVTSPDPRVLAAATSHGAQAIADEAGTLNGAVAAALSAAAGMGATEALVLPGDVPLVTPGDIAMLSAALPAGPGVAIAPTRDGGTGALLLRPPLVIPPAYGQGSFRRHVAGARLAGAAVAVRLLPDLALDLDRPEDLTRFLKQERWTRTGEFIAAVQARKREDHGCM